MYTFDPSWKMKFDALGAVGERHDAGMNRCRLGGRPGGRGRRGEQQDRDRDCSEHRGRAFRCISESPSRVVPQAGLPYPEMGTINERRFVALPLPCPSAGDEQAIADIDHLSGSSRSVIRDVETGLPAGRGGLVGHREAPRGDHRGGARIRPRAAVAQLARAPAGLAQKVVGSNPISRFRRPFPGALSRRYACFARRLGGVATQRPAKPFTPVRFR